MAEKKSVWRLRRHELQNAANVGQEAHVAHAVGFVQDQHLDVRQVDAAVAGQIEQAARAGDDDLGAAPQGLDLAILADAAIDGDAAHLRFPAQIDARLVDLFGQFARGRHDEGAHPAPGALGQPLQNGQHKGRGLAGAGLGYAQNVAPLQHDGDRLLLNRGGRGVPSRLDARVDARVKRKLFEIQVQYSLTALSQVALLTL